MMRQRQLLLLSIVAITLSENGCAENQSQSPTTSATVLHLDKIDPLANKRPTVATVNGVPVYSDCVIRQAEAHYLTVEQALQECIHFELLAQQATPYLIASDVQRLAKQEMVRAFVKARYPITSADEIPDTMEMKLWNIQQTRRRFQHPELRNIVFCRIPIAKDEATTSETYIAGKRFLDDVYEKLKTRRDLVENDLFGACYPHYKEAGVDKLDLNTFRTTPRDGYHHEFQAAVFDGPETQGMVLRPLRTRFGLDLILLTEVIEARHTPFEEARTELRNALFSNPVYETWRTSFFLDWYHPFENGLTIQRFFENIPATAVSTAAVSQSP